MYAKWAVRHRYVRTAPAGDEDNEEYLDEGLLVEDDGDSATGCCGWLTGGAKQTRPKVGAVRNGSLVPAW